MRQGTPLMNHMADSRCSDEGSNRYSWVIIHLLRDAVILSTHGNKTLCGPLFIRGRENKGEPVSRCGAQTS
jgi:hypothetical protein